MNELLELLDRESKPQTKRIVSFELDEINNHFNENIKSIEGIFEIYEQLENIEQKEDILRYQIMFLESALDFYMHEIIKYGMNKMYNGEWKRSDKYNNFRIKMVYAHRILDSKDDKAFDEIVNNAYSGSTFMSPTDIKNALKLLNINQSDIAKNVFYEENSKKKVDDKFKDFLSELHTRRNQIVHQSDRSHKDASKFNIEEDYVKNSIEKIKKIINAINNEIKRMDEST